MAQLKDTVVSGNLRVTDTVIADILKKDGGTSSQFLKADGSVDTNTYATVGDVNTALTSVLKYKGTIGTGGTITSLPATHAVGDVYVVSTAATYAGKACEVGDYIICRTAGTSANNAHWDVVNGENQVENKSASLAAAGSSATIATIDGTNITVTTPSGWTGLDKTGTLTNVTFNGTSASISNGVAAVTSTLDNVPDGTTRKLSNYVPKSGGMMDGGADLTFTGQSTDEVSINYEGVYLQDNSGDYPYTIYERDRIFRSDTNDNDVDILLPTTSGKIALESQIPSAPGTLNTNNTSAQSVNGSEALSGTVKLHKIAKTGTYNDLISKPYIENIYFVDGSSSAAGSSTSGAYLAVRWEGTVPGITEPYDGLKIAYRIKTRTGISNGGVVLSIDGEHYYPVVLNASTKMTSHYAVNSTIMLVFNSTLAISNVYLTSNVASTVTGCWQAIGDYWYDTNTIGYQLRTNSAILPSSDACRYYKLFFTSADGTKWVPASTNKSNDTTTARTVNQRPINPFGPIIYYNTTTNFSAGTNVAAANCWQQYTLSLGYSFNPTGGTLALTVNAPVYIKCAPQADGSAIIDSTQPYVQSLPSTEDGKIYIFLGIAYGETTVELYPTHPVYYYSDGAIRLWTNSGIEQKGFVIAAALNDLNDRVEEYSDDIATIKNNKVTSLSSSSTDAQYPSAKCVYDIITENELIVSSALNDLNVRILNNANDIPVAITNDEIDAIWTVQFS